MLYIHLNDKPVSSNSIYSCLSLCDIDSNEIDNSYAVAGAAEAAAEAEAAEDGVDADDVERIADDYVMSLGQGRNKNASNEQSNSRAPKVAAAATQATPTTSTTNAAAATTATATNDGRQLMNAKTQDLLSLSQLASYLASTSRTPHHEKSTASMKNSIAAGTAPGGTFQQIGSQRINGNVPAEATTVATTAAAAMRNDSSSSTHHHHTHGQQVELAAPTQSTSNVRTSARKVDSKFVLPKQQKTDAPMLNYIFDTHSSANKHHHHDQR